MDASNLGGNSPRVDVVEVVKGSSPLEGTLTLSYRDSITEDIAFDASEDEVRFGALSSLPHECYEAHPRLLW